jgi:outer membrane protein
MNATRLLVVAAAAAAITTGQSTAWAQDQREQVNQERLQEYKREAQKAAPQTLTLSMPRLAEGPRYPITVDDAVKFGLERNLNLAVQRLNPELQDINVVAATTVYQPQLTANVQRSSSTTTPTSQLQVGGGAGGATTSNNLAYNANVVQPVKWWGGQMSANFNNSRQDSNSNNATLNPQYSSTWTAQYTQPLLRDRVIDTQRRTIITSQIQRDISDINLKAQISNLAADIRNAYWDFVFAVESVAAANRSLEIATKLVEDNKIKVDVGTMAPIDVVQAQAEEARMRQSLVQAQNTRRTTELALKRLIVGGTDDPIWTSTLDPTDRPERNFTPQVVDEAALQGAISRALNERTDIAVVRKQIDSNNINMKFLRDQTLPILDLAVNYGVQGVGGTQLVRSQGGVLGSQVVNTIPGGIGDALSSLLRARNPRWTVGVNVTYPIGLNTSDTALARSRVQLNQNQSQLKLLQLQVENDVTTAAINLRNSAEAVEVSRLSMQLSEQRLAAEQSKFEVGMSTNFQVVQAQRDLDDAVNVLLRSVLSYQRSLVEFDRVQQNGAQANFTAIN